MGRSKNDNGVVLLSSRREHQCEGIFGCPACRLHSGYYQVYREFWFYCHVHRTKWLDDAFWTDTRPTPEEIFRAIDQLAGYREVAPFCVMDGTAEEQAAFWARTEKKLNAIGLPNARSARTNEGGEPVPAKRDDDLPFC